MDTFIPQQYQLQKYLGVWDGQYYFLAKNALQENEVIFNLVVFGKSLPPVLWQSLLSYYRALFIWSQTIEQDNWIPFHDFGEISLHSNLPICQQLQNFCPEILTQGRFAVYFTSLKEDWQFISEYRQNPFELTPSFVHLLETLHIFHEQGIYTGNISQNNIMFSEKKEGILLAFSNLGISSLAYEFWKLNIAVLENTPNLSQLPDSRNELYSLSFIWYQIITGEEKLPTQHSSTQENRLVVAGDSTSIILYEHLKKAPEPLAVALCKCLHNNPSQRLNDSEEFWSAISSLYPNLSPNLQPRQFLLPSLWDFSENEKEFLSNEFPIQIWRCGQEIAPKLISYIQRLYSQKSYSIIHWNCSVSRNFPLIEIANELQNILQENSEYKIEESLFFYSHDHPLQNYRHIRQNTIQHILNVNQPTALFITNFDLASPELWDYFKYLLHHLVMYKRNIPFRIFVAYTPGSSENFENFIQRLQEDSSIKTIIQTYNKPELSYHQVQHFINQKLGLKENSEQFSQYVSKITQNNPFHIELILTILVRKKLLYRTSQKDWCLTSNQLEDLGIHHTLPDTIQEWLGLFSKDALQILDWYSITGWDLPWALVAQTCPTLDRSYSVFCELAQNNVLQFANLSLSITSPELSKYLQAHRPLSLSVSNRMSDAIRQYPFLPFRDIALANLFLLNHQTKSCLSYCAKIMPLFFELGLESSLEFWWEQWQKLRNQQDIPNTILLDWAWKLRKHEFIRHSMEIIPNALGVPELLLKMLQLSWQDRDYENCGYFLKLLKQIQSEPNELWQASYYGFKAKLLYVQQSFDESNKSFLKALAILQNWFVESEQKKLCLELYEYLLSDSLLLESIPSLSSYLQDGFNMAIHLKNISSQIHFLYSLGWGQKYAGQYSIALHTLQKSFELAQQYHYPQWQIQILLEMTEIYCFLGTWKKALNLFNQATLLSKKEGIKSFKFLLSLHKARIIILQSQENFTANAEELYREAFEQSQRSNIGNHFRVTILSELSRLLAYKNEQVALQIWGQAFQEWKSSPTVLREIQLNLAKLELDMSSEQPPALILEIAQKTLGLIDKFQYNLFLPLMLKYLGLANRSNGNISLAVENLRKCLYILDSQVEKLAIELQENYLKNLGTQEVKNLIVALTKDLTKDTRQNIVEVTTPQSSLDERKNTTAKRKLNEIQATTSLLSESEKQGFQEQRKQIERLRKLTEINQKLNSEHDVRRLLDIIMDAAIELTQAERGFLILNTTAQERDFEIARNFEKEDVSNPQFEISHSITEKVIRTGIPILAKDAVQDGRFDGYRSVTELKLHSILAVPLRIKEKIIGALYLDNRFEKSVFSESDKELLEAFADQSAIAIENANLLNDNIKKQEELRKSKEQIERLNQKLAIANAKLTQKIERREEELQEVKIILQRNQSELVGKYQYHNLIGRSLAMQEIFKILEKVTDKNIPVLIYGESGTGKELVARAIHYSGCRKDKNFLSENCAAISDTLLASELFGHVKGSFTGAYSDKKGLFELSDAGTLFLDEVGDMTPSMQANLLRVLENGVIRRVGGKDEIPVDVRIISASNKNLTELVSQGKFREDLLFRLKVVEIIIPPLRERKEDIPILVDHFLREYAQESKTTMRSIDKNALAILIHYNWPGNVRELRNTLYKVLSLNDEAELNAGHFKSLTGSSTPKNIDFFSQEVSIDDYARLFVQYKQSQYNDSQLAKILGFSRKTLWEKRKKWGLFRST